MCVYISLSNSIRLSGISSLTEVLTVIGVALDPVFVCSTVESGGEGMVHPDRDDFQPPLMYIYVKYMLKSVMHLSQWRIKPVSLNLIVHLCTCAQHYIILSYYIVLVQNNAQETTDHIIVL